MSDPRKYRTKEEEEKYIQEDPILKVMNTIRKNKYASDKELDAIETRLDSEIQEAIKFAEESPFPTPEDLYNDVYVQNDYPYIKEY
jgi:pyruvate dehydrogenase E1 component alpha subunit